MKRAGFWALVLCFSLIVVIAGVRLARVARRELRHIVPASTFATSDGPAYVPQVVVPRALDFLQPPRLDAWHIIGPGGGGTFYNPTISPHDPNLVFTTTDMGTCYVSENGGHTWRSFNLRGGCRFVFDPKLPDRVYALSVGMFRSDDRGRTWSLVYPDGAAEVHYTEVEGSAAMFFPGGGYDYGVFAMAIDPDDSKTMYASIGAGPPLKVSHDAGKTWTLLADDAWAEQLWVDPTSPRGKRTVYIHYRNQIGTWDGNKYVKREVPGPGNVTGAAFAIPSRGGKPVIYVSHDSEVKGGERAGGLMATEDGGQTWRSLNGGIEQIAAKNTFPEFSILTASQNHGEVLYVGYSRFVPPNDDKGYFGVMKSSDGGVTWAPVRQEASAIAPNMHNDWTSSRFSPDFGDQPMSMTVDDNNPDLVYTGDLARVMRSTDGGKNWTGVFSQSTGKGYTTTGLDVTNCYGIHFDPFDPKNVFIGYTDIGLMRSEDGGESWLGSFGKGLPPDWRHNTYWVEFDPAVKGRVWAVMTSLHDLPFPRVLNHWGPAQGGVASSVDGGATWTATAHGIPPSNAPTHILLDPRSPVGARVLYVASMGRGVYKSSDGGQNWVLKNEGLPPEPLAWRLAITGDGTLYLVTIRRSEDGKYGNDKDGWLFRSHNGADSWERVPLPEGLNGPMGITVDPRDPVRLYLSVWGRYTSGDWGKPAPNGGVYLSEDAGIHWQNVLTASRRIYDVTVDPHNPDVVYAAGFEAAAWRSADRGKTWNRIKGFNFSGGHRVTVDPVDPSQIYITTMGNSVWHGPALGDPKAVEDIVSPPSVRFDAPRMK